MQELLRTNSLTLESWLVLGAIASVVIVAMELYKWLRRAAPA